MRRLRVVVVFLVVGVVLNVLVAWAAAAWGTLGPGAMNPMLEDSPGSLEVPRLAWRTPVPEGWSDPTSVVAGRGVGIAVQHASARPGTATVIRAGWPWYSMQSAQLWQAATSAPKPAWFRGGFELPGRIVELEIRSSRVHGMRESGPGLAQVPNVIVTTRSHKIPRHLPVDPLWIGFIANTLAAAAMCAAASWAFLAIRRALRVRGGLCGACGYSRSGLTNGSACPECGSVSKGVVAKPQGATV